MDCHPDHRLSLSWATCIYFLAQSYIYSEWFSEKPVLDSLKTVGFKSGPENGVISSRWVNRVRKRCSFHPTLILKLKIASGTMIVISSATVAKELLDKTGWNASSRPSMFLVDQVTDGNHMGFMKDG